MENTKGCRVRAKSEILNELVQLRDQNQELRDHCQSLAGQKQQLEHELDHARLKIRTLLTRGNV